MMRATYILMAILAAATLSAAETAVPDAVPVAITLFSDGSTNLWTQGDLQAALQLTNRKYHRDMLKSNGRIDWHGPVVRRVVETNDLRLIEYHEDGFAWTNRWAQPRTLTPTDWALKAKALRQARAQALAAQTNGVPKILADARQAGLVSMVETNVVINANR